MTSTTKQQVLLTTRDIGTIIFALGRLYIHTEKLGFNTGVSLEYHNHLNDLRNELIAVQEQAETEEVNK